MPEPNGSTAQAPFQDNELDLKVLERSSQQLDNARSSLSRDVTALILVLLAFQFVIFFRFISLNDQDIEIDRQIAQAIDDRQIVDDIAGLITELNTDIKTGKEQLTKELEGAPSRIRNRIVELEDYINDLRSASPSDRIPSPPSTGAGIEIQVPLPTPSEEFGPVSPVFLDDLSDEDIAGLAELDPMGKAFEDLVEGMVDENIVRSEFDRLNEFKRGQLQKPLSAKWIDLLSKIDSAEGIFVKYNLPQLKVELDAERDALNGFDLVAPPNLDWWRTLADKEREFGWQIINTEAVIDLINNDVTGQRNTMEVLGERIEVVTRNAMRAKADVEREQERLKQTLDDLQLSLSNYSNPLPWIALPLRDVVLYYPPILAVVLVYFCLRYWQLYARAFGLAKAYAKRGLSAEVARSYLGGFVATEVILRPTDSEQYNNDRPAPDYEVMERRGKLLAIVGAFLVITGTLFGFSTLRIFFSENLRPGAPLVIYLASAAVIVLVVAFWLRGLLSFRPSR